MVVKIVILISKFKLLRRTMTERATKTAPALALKGGLYTLTAIQVYRMDLAAIVSELDDKIKQAPKFFQNTPIVIDLYHLPQDTTPDLMALMQVFRDKTLIPIGIKGAKSKTKEIALQAGLAILPETKLPEKVEPAAKPVHTENAHFEIRNPPLTENAPASISGSRLITQPVRSGQQIYASGGDLVILSSVSAGAELLAEGHIHVHGPLRGRALAGINGDTHAIIYCKSLEAELVSIAGQYRIIEDLKENNLWKRAVCIQLKENKLHIEAV